MAPVQPTDGGVCHLLMVGPEQEYAPELELLSRELTIYRPMKLRVVPPAPPRSKPVCECGCGRRIRIAARVLERGVIRCGLCEGAFAWRQVPA
jgi:hypothetical protein